VRTRLALIAVLAAAAFPSAALADDQAPAPSPEPAPAPSCLAAKGQAPDDQSVRGVHVGGRAVIRGADGNPLPVVSVSYCVNGGGVFSFALSQESDIVLVLSTAEGDAIGRVNPTVGAQSARRAFPNMKRLTRSGATGVYRVDARRQLIFGVADGRVNFVAAADRLLLEYPSKLRYYLKRLGF
jgi:hypothetical protein